MSQAIKSLWPGTLFAAGLLYFCTHETPYFVWQALPIMGSLLLSIPLVYFTSKTMPEVLRKWI
jgi:membrane glycosyltransferase